MGPLATCPSSSVCPAPPSRSLGHVGGWPAPEEACLGNRVRPDARPQDSAAPSAGPRPLSTPGRPARQPPANTPPPGPTHTTCGEPRLAGGLLHGHGERGGRRGGLRPGQRPVAAEGHGDASGLHGGLVVPQLVDALLLQQESLLRGDGGGHVRQRASLPPQAVRPSHARPPAALLPTRPAGAGWGAPHRGMQTPPRLPPSPPSWSPAAPALLRGQEGLLVHRRAVRLPRPRARPAR